MTTTQTGHPVMYLDVDDTLLTFNEAYWRKKYGAGINALPVDHIVAAPGAGAFLRWSVEHYEVRWLTCWTGSGVMGEDAVRRLSKALDVPPEMIAGIRGRPWGYNNKTEGIDFDDPRPFRELLDQRAERHPAHFFGPQRSAK